MATEQGTPACEYATIEETCDAEAEVVLVQPESGFTGEQQAAKNVYCRSHAAVLLEKSDLEWEETDDDPIEVRA